jgi:hypothetical protein
MSYSDRYFTNPLLRMHAHVDVDNIGMKIWYVWYACTVTFVWVLSLIIGGSQLEIE